MGKDTISPPAIPDLGVYRVEGRAGFATAMEAAEFLRLSKGMIHKMIGEGKVPASRYGRAVRITWAWLRAQAVEY